MDRHEAERAARLARDAAGLGASLALLPLRLVVRALRASRRDHHSPGAPPAQREPAAPPTPAQAAGSPAAAAARTVPGAASQAPPPADAVVPAPDVPAPPPPRPGAAPGRAASPPPAAPRRPAGGRAAAGRGGSRPRPRGARSATAPRDAGLSAADAARIREADRAAQTEPDSPGPELRVQEPWEGYDAMNVAGILGRLRGGDPALLAIVRLYEETHKNRIGVLRATGSG
jgi:hypothetical protein